MSHCDFDLDRTMPYVELIQDTSMYYNIYNVYETLFVNTVIVASSFLIHIHHDQFHSILTGKVMIVKHLTKHSCFLNTQLTMDGRL